MTPAQKNREVPRATPDPESAGAEKNRQGMDVLLSVSQMVAGNLDLDEVLQSAMEAASEALEAEACSILLQDPDSGELRFRLLKGDHTRPLDKVRVPVDDHSIAGWVAGHGQGLLVPDAYEDPRFNRRYDTKTGFRTRSVICVPLLAKGRQLGVMQILNRRDGRAFGDRDLELSEAVAGLVAVAIHNAEEHEARMKAERVATVGQTIAGLAHCVKNILNGVQAGSYIIDQNLQGQESSPVVRGWRMVRRNLNFLSNVVLDMLSYSKQRAPLRRPCRINELCRDVAALLEEQAREKEVRLAAELGAGLPEVHLDDSGIRRCLINLVGNAIDACEQGAPGGGLVVIETALADDPGRLRVCVRDNGCGIEQSKLQKMFDPFYSTKGNKGTGLGLAVTRKIVREHGGSISVESAPGQGTAFVLEIPVQPDSV
ncbi:MAG: GAF domain-containing protein [Anaerolineaceae bacterium]|nr:GAF domain-containing protein [Anaerolineaceae bacterium]